MAVLSERRVLKRCGLAVAVLGLGGAAIGNLHGNGAASDSEAGDVLDGAWRAGVRFFDTAPLYGHGLGELRTGAALGRRARDEYVLSSKVGWRVDRLDGLAQAGQAGTQVGRAVLDYSRDGTLRSVEQSLARLGLSRLDIALVHDVDPWNHGDAWKARLREALDGALPALAELKRQGAVRAVGVAVNNVDVCLEVLRSAEVDVFMLAGRYTLLDRSAGDELLPECQQRGVGVIIAAPFNSGILGGGRVGRFNYRPPSIHMQRHVVGLEAECKAADVSLKSAALQFPLRHPAVTAVVAGPRNREQLAGIVGAFSEPIPDQLWPRLAEPSPRPLPQLRE